MAETITRLSTQLSLETQGVAAGRVAFDKEMDRLVRNAEMAGQQVARTGRGFSGLQVAAGQAVFAIDDFASQLQTAGFAAGIRAAGNNITFMASQLFGLQGQILALTAVIGAQFLVNFIEGLSDSNEEAERLKQTMDELVSVQREAASIRNEQRQRDLRALEPMEERGALELQRELLLTDQKRARVNQDIADIARRRDAAIRGEQRLLTIQEENRREGVFPFRRASQPFTDEMQVQLEGLQATIEELTSQLEDVRGESEALGDTFGQLQEQLPEAQERAARDEAQRLREQFAADEAALQEARRQAPAVPGFGAGDFTLGRLNALLAQEQFLEDQLEASRRRRITALPGATEIGSQGAASIISRGIARGLQQSGRETLEQEQLTELQQIREEIRLLREQRREENFGVANF